ncbi:rluC, partial [Symbiodinium pilosum]
MDAFLKFVPALEEKHRQWQLAQHTFWTMGSRAANLPNFPCEQCCNIFNRVLAAAKQWEVCLVLLDTMCSHRKALATPDELAVLDYNLLQTSRPGSPQILAARPGIVAVAKPPDQSSEDILKKLADGVLQASGSQNLAQFTSCSRLDLPTSGVLVVAHGKPGSPAANWLQAQFASRFSVGKNYLCLCFGQPLGDPGTEGEINTPLLVMSGEGMSGLAVPSDQGLEACTQYEVLASYPISRISAQDSDAADTNEFIYLRVHPLTGRMHQIR